MKLVSYDRPVTARWLVKEGRRFDAGPFLSGAVEARLLLEELDVPKEPLLTLTKGHQGGIYNGPMFKRRYVDDPEHGVPFITSSSFMLADLSTLSLLSKKDARSRKLSYLELHEGTTLISCSGTIGRMGYVRSDMAGMWSSQDVLKVVPDPGKIPPGYLYAYLSSKYGVPLIVSGTYGAIIQHIEPEHIAALPVPRIGSKSEAEIHSLVQDAAELRASATEVLASCERLLEEAFGSPPQAADRRPTSQVHSSTVRAASRIDGFFFNENALRVEAWIAAHAASAIVLGDIANVYDVPPFKHIYVEDDHGVPFYPSGELFLLSRHHDKNLSRTQTKNLSKYIIEQGTVLLARSGQLGGIIGRPQYTDASLDGCSTSDHVIRIVPRNGEISPGYVYAYLAWKAVGYPLITRTASGSSVPALWPVYLRNIPVLRPSKQLNSTLAKRVPEAFQMRLDATEAENRAIRCVEDALLAQTAPPAISRGKAKP